jgi:hypothetical protein
MDAYSAARKGGGRVSETSTATARGRVMAIDAIEEGKNWLAQEARAMGATGVEWGRGKGDFDGNLWSVRVHISGASVTHKFSEFDLAKVPGDEGLAALLRSQLRASMSSGPSQKAGKGAHLA